MVRIIAKKLSKEKLRRYDAAALNSPVSCQLQRFP